MANEAIVRPKWLSDNFLRQCIRNAHSVQDTEVTIDKLVLSYVVPKGENYLSVMYRAAVTYTDTSASEANCLFVLKAEHEDPKMTEAMDPMFTREIDMYTIIVPALHQKLESHHIEDKFICRYIHELKEHPRVVVLEDLKPMGFKVGDRMKGLDFRHTKLVLDRLAKFHAASMMYFQGQSKEVKERYSVPPFATFRTKMANPKMIEVRKRSLERIVSVLVTHNGKYEKAVKFLENYIECIGPSSKIIPQTVSGNMFNSLVHGDCWINNIMFKYSNDGKINDLLFIDYQLSHYTTCAYDFSYFIHSSTSVDVKINHFEEVKMHYLVSLTDNLKLLQYDGRIPTMAEFDNELKHCVGVVVWVLTLLLPIVFVQLENEDNSREESKAFSTDELMQIVGINNKDQFYFASLEASLGVLQEGGYFDVFPEAWRN